MNYCSVCDGEMCDLCHELGCCCYCNCFDLEVLKKVSNDCEIDNLRDAVLEELLGLSKKN